MADKNLILIIYLCIFILLIPLLKSYLKSQRLQNKISYIGMTFWRRWAIKSSFYRLRPLIFSIAQTFVISSVMWKDVTAWVVPFGNWLEILAIPETAIFGSLLLWNEEVFLVVVVTKSPPLFTRIQEFMISWPQCNNFILHHEVYDAPNDITIVEYTCPSHRLLGRNIQIYMYVLPVHMVQ